MTERPILFTPDNVRAILGGQKWQTRRVVKSPYTPEIHTSDSKPWPSDCPYGAPGDALWVREAWAVDAPLDQVRAAHEDVMSGMGYGPYYKADKAHENAGLRWRNAMYMPRWAARLTLRITDVRVERVQDISEEDAIAEGTQAPGVPAAMTNRSAYARIWDNINTKRGYGWGTNPWVWVLGFEVLR